MMILNFPLLFVFQLAPVQFFFGDRQNLLHRFAEFLGWILLGRWHVAIVTLEIWLANVPNYFRLRMMIVPSSGRYFRSSSVKNRFDHDKLFSLSRRTLNLTLFSRVQGHHCCRNLTITKKSATRIGAPITRGGSGSNSAVSPRFSLDPGLLYLNASVSMLRFPSPISLSTYANISVG